MGDEMVREEGRGTRASAVHPGSCSPSQRPWGEREGERKGEGRRGMGRTAGRAARPRWSGAELRPRRARAKAFGAYLGPAQPLTPLGRCVPSRGSGSFLKEKVIKGAGWRAEFPGSSAIPRPTGDFPPTSCASQWALLSRRHSSPFTLRPGPTFPPESTIQLPLPSPPLYLL